jgi:hypothetical protein
MVGRDVAVAMTVGTVAWGALLTRAREGRRVAYGMAAWLAIELVFFGAAHRARAAVRAAVGPETYRDAVLTPAVGDPRCVSALLVEVDGPTYRVTTGTVAPFPRLRDVQRCRAPRAIADAGMRASARAPTAQTRWGGEWSAPRAELAALAGTNCEIAAALRFIRVPAWTRRADDTIQLYDLRYADRRGGFAELVTASRVDRCPGAVPGWTPPRRDVLGPR